MKKIIIFFYLCASIFSQWLSYDRTNELFPEKEIGLINIGDKSSFLVISKVQEYIPIYSENGKEIFTKPQKEYFEVTFDFLDFLKYETINNLKTIDISNEKGERLKNLEIQILRGDLVFNIEPSYSGLFIDFLKKSKIVKVSFLTDENRKITETYRVDAYEENEKLISPKKIHFKEDFDKSEILSETQYIVTHLELTNECIYNDGEYILIKFKILNKGNKNIEKLSVLFRYFDDNGLEIGQQELYPIFEGSLFGDLKANSVYRMKDNDFFSIKIPSNWTNKYELKINKIKIKESK